MIESTLLALGFAALSSLPGVLAQDAPENPEESASESASASALPSASSVPDSKCKIDEKTGKEICGTHSVPGTLPTSAKIAIAVVTLTVVFLIIATFFCIRRSRRASAEAAKEVAVEASQLDGPPAILGATYTPETGHSRVYSIGPDSGGLSAAVPVPLTPAQGPAPVLVPPSAGIRGGGTPAFPSPSVARSSSFNRFGSTNASSAPAHKANFSEPSYPFTGFGNNSGASGSSNGKSTGQQPKSAFVSQGGFPRPLLAGRLKDRIRERPPSISSMTDSPTK